MKKFVCVLIFLFCIAFFATSLFADDVYVRGYFRSNGTYVQPHYRSSPDGNFWNNWSTYGNINPYTGSLGTRRYPSYSSSSLYGNYSSPSYNSSSLYGSYSSSYGSYSKSLYGSLFSYPKYKSKILR